MACWAEGPAPRGGGGSAGRRADVNGKGRRIDVALLAAMLNPAIFVILLGYSVWGVLRYIASRQSQS